jgi:hypothetical protein
MKTTEQIAPVGIFEIKVFDRAGNLVQHAVERNLIVNGGYNALARLLGGDVANRSIDRIAFGDNGTAPAEGNTGLTNPIYKEVTPSYPSTGEVAFAWELDYAEGNGKNIREFGLFTVGTVLFSRKARSVIAKTSDIRLEGTWRVLF